MRRVLNLLAAATLSVAALSACSATVPANAQETDARQTAVTVRLHPAVRQLPVGRETRRGYDRDRFRHWVDADGDCRDTRDEVLAAESRDSVSGCDIRSGRWLSYYDRLVWTNSADVDIDHLVALAEAWDSGARRWNARTPERVANDLGDGRSLGAVTDNVNM